MKYLFVKIGTFFAGVFSLIGNLQGNDFGIQKALHESQQVSEETPLYLDEASHVIKNTETSNLLAWHSSHASHASHRSHYSHYSGR